MQKGHSAHSQIPAWQETRASLPEAADCPPQLRQAPTHLTRSHAGGHPPPQRCWETHSSLWPCCPKEGKPLSEEPHGHTRAVLARQEQAQPRYAPPHTLPFPPLTRRKDYGAGTGNFLSCQGMNLPLPVSRRHKAAPSGCKQTGFVQSSRKHHCFYLKQKTQDVTDEWKNVNCPTACRAPQTGECFSGSQRVSRQD